MAQARKMTKKDPIRDALLQRVGQLDARKREGANAIKRAEALKVHVENLSPNLLRAYVLDMLELAPDQEVDKLVVAFHAQSAVPGKGIK